MDPKIKKKWLKALRSGEYRQGETALCKPCNGGDKFCCLGVLINLVDPRQWEDDPDFPGLLMYEKCNDMPPDMFLEKLDLDRGDAGRLALMNDMGKRFSTIANYIEKHL